VSLDDMSLIIALMIRRVRAVGILVALNLLRGVGVQMLMQVVGVCEWVLTVRADVGSLHWLMGVQVGSEPAFFVCGIEAEVTLKWPGQFGVVGLQVGLKIWLLLEGPLAEVTGEGMGGRLDTGGRSGNMAYLASHGRCVG